MAKRYRKLKLSALLQKCNTVQIKIFKEMLWNKRYKCIINICTWFFPLCFLFLEKEGQGRSNLNRTQLYVPVYEGKIYMYIMNFPDNVGLQCNLELYLSHSLHIVVFYTLPCSHLASFKWSIYTCSVVHLLNKR